MPDISVSAVDPVPRAKETNDPNISRRLDFVQSPSRKKYE